MRIVFFLLAFLFTTVHSFGQHYQLYFNQSEFYVFYIPDQTLDVNTFTQRNKIPLNSFLKLNQISSVDSVYRNKTIKLPINKAHIYKESDLKHNQDFAALKINQEATKVIPLIQKRLNISNAYLRQINKVKDVKDLNRKSDIIIAYFRLPSDESWGLFEHFSHNYNALKNTNLFDSNSNMENYQKENKYLQEYLIFEGDAFENSLKKHKAEEQRGAAVFYKAKYKHHSIFVLHNEAPRGSIVKITNPENNISVYGKVVGTIPPTERYRNAIIAISGNAATMLGAHETKLFVQTTYINQ